MKVYNIAGIYNGCYYVRQYLPQIMNGWDGDYMTMSHIRMPEYQAKAAMQADIVVFHRPDSKEKLELAQLLKGMGKKIVLDNDDTYLQAGGALTNFEAGYLKKMNHNLYEFAEKYADVITVSTQELKNEYSQFGKPVEVLENCVYPIHIPLNKPNKTNKLRIGLVGSAVMYADWKGIHGLMAKLNKDDSVKLVIYGLRPKKERTKCDNMVKILKHDLKMLDGLTNAEWQGSTHMHEYFNTLSNLSLDIMLIPREDTYFNTCKSNLKFLEATVMGIPCIVQSFKDGNSPYDRLPENVCIKCKTEEDFSNAIELLRDKSIRDSIVKDAREYVDKHYNIKNNAHKWADVYKQLMS